MKTKIAPSFGKDKAALALSEKLNQNPRYIRKTSKLVNETVDLINILKTLEKDKHHYLLTMNLYRDYMMNRINMLILDESIVSFVRNIITTKFRTVNPYKSNKKK